MPDPSKGEEIRAYWNSRAGLGQWAGTRDTLAKQLEIEAIAGYVRHGMRVLEVGCGNGITAIELARRFRIRLTAIDYAEEMVRAARQLAAGHQLLGSVAFEVGDVNDLAGFQERFDLCYTERVLINLPDWLAQRNAILAIGRLLADDGLYVMCENSQDGLDRINALRQRIGLTAIAPPWYNRYLRDAELDPAAFPGLELQETNFYSSTYYFLSRVVNAWLAAREGKEPDYEAPVNQLALQLPALGELAQGRIWVWRKARSRGAPEGAAGQE